MNDSDDPRNRAQDLCWITASNPPGHNKPRWMLSAAVDSEGTVFAPAVITGNEQKALLCAIWDGGVPLVSNDGHPYLPVRWLAAYCPEEANLCMLIERKVKAAIAGK